MEVTLPGFYEVIYETGEHSVAYYADDAEALSAVGAQHLRAVTGELGGPEGTAYPASRVKRVLVYDRHPQDLYESQTVEVKTVEEWLKKSLEKNAMGDLVSVPMVIADMRNELDALVADSAPHESNYKMNESRELKSADWEKVA